MSQRVNTVEVKVREKSSAAGSLAQPGTALKWHREARQMTQRQLAEIAGVSIRLLQDYEQGRRDINPKFVKLKIRNSYNMPIIIAWNHIRPTHLLSDDMDEHREGRAPARPHLFMGISCQCGRAGYPPSCQEFLISRPKVASRSEVT